MEKQFQALSAAIDILDWQKRRNSLRIIQENYENSQYFVAFIGQFSAGKSFLINNILGRTILPTGIQETTPLLTYIRYGSREKARLYYLDGAVREISLDEVRSLVQNGSQWDLPELDYLEIFLTDALLARGLILLDTPGSNTVIQRHQRLLARSLDLASRIVYVTGQALHATDTELLQAIKARGKEIAVVRTHCDEIKASEETLEDVIQGDLDVLNKIGIPNDDCFHVSNLQTAPEFQTIQSLRNFLAQIGNSITSELEKATLYQLEEMRKVCTEALEKRRDVLQQEKEGNERDRAEKLRLSSQRITDFESKIDEHRQQLDDDLKRCAGELQSQVTRKANALLEDAVEQIENCPENIRDTNSMRNWIDRVSEQLFFQVMAEINLAVTPLLSGIQEDFKIHEFSLKDMDIPAPDSFSDLIHQQDYEAELLRDKLNALRSNSDKLKEKLEQMNGSPEYQQLQASLRELEEAIVAGKSQYDARASYTPKLIAVEDGKAQPSEIARTIGGIADWALLLLPGGAIGGAINGMANVPGIVGKFATFIGTKEKVLSIINKGDALKDTIFALQNMSKTYKTAGRIEKATNVINKVATGAEAAVALKKAAVGSGAPSSFLDYFTIQYWAEQIGKKFDRPPKLEVDQEYERQYLEEGAKIRQELIHRQNLLYQEKVRLRAFESERERLQSEAAAREVNEQAVRIELAKREQQLKEDAEKKALAEWRRNCSLWYQSQVSVQLDKMMKETISTLKERLHQYQEVGLQKILSRLEEERKIYQRLDNDAVSTEDLEQVTFLLQQLKEAFV